jgi:hypothetical protein
MMSLTRFADVKYYEMPYAFSQGSGNSGILCGCNCVTSPWWLICDPEFPYSFHLICPVGELCLQIHMWSYVSGHRTNERRNGRQKLSSVHSVQYSMRHSASMWRTQIYRRVRWKLWWWTLTTLGATNWSAALCWQVRSALPVTCYKGKKGKGHPTTGHEGPEGE